MADETTPESPSAATSSADVFSPAEYEQALAEAYPDTFHLPEPPEPEPAPKATKAAKS